MAISTITIPRTMSIEAIRAGDLETAVVEVLDSLIKAAYLTESMCQPGFTHWPFRNTNISVTRPENGVRFPSFSNSYSKSHMRVPIEAMLSNVRQRRQRQIRQRHFC
jgi:hypothetical protein